MTLCCPIRFFLAGGIASVASIASVAHVICGEPVVIPTATRSWGCLISPILNPCTCPRAGTPITGEPVVNDLPTIFLAPAFGILGSPHNPKFLWVDDAEIVGDRI